MRDCRRTRSYHESERIHGHSSLLVKTRSQETDSHTTAWSIIALATSKSQFSVSVTLVDKILSLLFLCNPPILPKHQPSILVEPAVWFREGESTCLLSWWPKQTRWQWRLISEWSLQQLVKQPYHLWEVDYERHKLPFSWLDILWFCLFSVMVQHVWIFN